MFVLSQSPATLEKTVPRDRSGPHGDDGSARLSRCSAGSRVTDFVRGFWIVVLLALAWRVGYVLVTKRHDAGVGRLVRVSLRREPPRGRQGLRRPAPIRVLGPARSRARRTRRCTSSTWPPGRSSGCASALWHRLASCVLGAATVGLVGLLGRRLAGERAGPDRGRARRGLPAPLAQRRGAALGDRRRVRGGARDARRRAVPRAAVDGACAAARRRARRWRCSGGRSS